jgi:preprotein translocase subunit SecG
METLIWVVHVLVCLGIIGLVLMQHGKGADMGAAFGSGSSGSLFGATGSANFLSRATAVLVTVFFITSLSLTYIVTHRTRPLGVMETQPITNQAPPSADANKTAPSAGNAAPPSKAADIPK